MRNSTLLVVWMVLACIHLIYMAIYLIRVLIWLSGSYGLYSQYHFEMIFVAITIVAIILFDIWTLIVVKNAKKEIDGGDTGGKIFATRQDV